MIIKAAKYDQVFLNIEDDIKLVIMISGKDLLREVTHLIIFADNFLIIRCVVQRVILHMFIM